MNTLQVDWDLDELLGILGALPKQDLLWFLQPHFQQEDISGWKEEELLELGLFLFQDWGRECKEPGEFLRLAASNLCRGSLEAFVRFFWDSVPGSQALLWNWHMSFLCEEMQAVSLPVFEGRTRPHDLIINIPPGSSKSSICSVLFPCWTWTRMPKCRLITSSHTDSLVTDLASKSRDVMRGDRYRVLFPEIMFSESTDSKGHYRNTMGGERFTCTVAGKSPVGQHCHIALHDDPTDPKKVLSEAERKTAADFFTKVMPSRRMRGALGDLHVSVLIMQRLGVGDPTDVVLETNRREGAWPVKHVCLPAELTEDVSPKELEVNYTRFNADANQDPKGLLDPVRLSRRTLDEQRALLGEWAYAGQFLQKPRPQMGGMFKVQYFSKRIKAAPFSARRVRYWDRASSANTTACATAGILMAYDGEKLYLEDLVYGRWEPDERNAVMLATAQRDRTRYGKYEPIIYVEAEGGSSGRDAWLGVVRTLIGFPVREDRVQGSKDTRAEPWSTQLASGNVWLVDNGEQEGIGRSGWDINMLIEHHLQFRPEPGKRLGREKDIVDASCLVAGTLVETENGPVPIEEIKEGMGVLTRDGYRRVLWAGCSGRTEKLVSVRFSNGSVLTGTPEHLVLTLQRGFVRLNSLVGTDQVVPLPFVERKPWRERSKRRSASYVGPPSSGLSQPSVALPSVLPRSDGSVGEEPRTSTTELNLTVESIGDVCQMGDITLVREGRDSIERCGSFTTGVFPTDITFITRTGMNWTTESKTLNVSLRRSMPKGIPTETISRGGLNTSNGFESSLLSGTGRRREGSGTAKQARKLSPIGSPENSSAIGVETSSNPLVTELQGRGDSVLPFVPIESGTVAGDEKRNEPASSAERRTEGVVNPFSAATPVLRLGNGPIEVYDLKVDSVHEFFANGILVHNSGAFNLLVGHRRAFPALRTIPLRYRDKGDSRRIIVCLKDELPMLELDHNKASLLVYLKDPEVTSLVLSPPTPIVVVGVERVGLTDYTDYPTSVHHLPKNLGEFRMAFADVDPAQRQGPEYDLPIEPWNKTIQELQLSREDAKRLWSFLLKKREPPWTVVVLVDEDGNEERAMSVAYGMADGLRVPRSAIYLFGEDGVVCTDEDKPPNDWVYSQTKLAKAYVMES